MARPREFNEEDALRRAMEVFWRRGYAATSVRELGTELGLQQSSLYAAFGDKHTLFLRALDHYLVTESATAHRRLSTGGHPQQVLRAWLMDSIDTLCRDPDAKGCFMVNTATELAAGDAEAGDRVREAFAGIRNAVRDLLRRGQRDGLLDGGLDVDGVSALLTTTMLGLRVQGRAGADRADLAAAGRTALALVH